MATWSSTSADSGKPRAIVSAARAPLSSHRSLPPAHSATQGHAGFRVSGTIQSQRVRGQGVAGGSPLGNICGYEVCSVLPVPAAGESSSAAALALAAAEGLDKEGRRMRSLVTWAHLRHDRMSAHQYRGRAHRTHARRGETACTTPHAVRIQGQRGRPSTKARGLDASITGQKGAAVHAEPRRVCTDRHKTKRYRHKRAHT